MPQVKPFHPDLEQKLEELFKCRHGEMPCKEERTKLGAPYAESAMRVQSWFTRKARARAKVRHDQDGSRRVPIRGGSRAEDLRSLHSVQPQRNLSPILIKHLEGRFTKDGPRSPSEKAFKRISETYNVSRYSIEKWWHCRRRTGGKLCIPRHPEHRGGKLAELEVGTTVGRRLSASHIFSPSNKIFKARAPLTASPVLFLERPETPGSEATYLYASSSPESILLQDVVESSTPSSPLESIVKFAHRRDADTISSASFSSPCPSSRALMPFISSAPSPTFSGLVSESTSVYGQIFAPYLAVKSSSAYQDLIWDLHHETMATRKNMNRVHSLYARMYAASELETASFFESDDPHWRLVGQDLMAAVQYERSRALWDLENKSDKSRQLSEESSTKVGELKLSGETSGDVDKLIQQYVHCGDDFQGPQNSKRLFIDTSDSVLSPLACATLDCSKPRPLGSSISGPFTPYSTSTPCLSPDRLLEPIDPTSDSPDTSCVSTPSPEISEDLYLSDHEDQHFLYENQESKNLTDSGFGTLPELGYSVMIRASHHSMREYYEP